MSDAPMSRRARRALEEQAAERMAHENLGIPADAPIARPATGDMPLSRRDRRRLERLQRPMETWTAEEEMIATGQIPVLTPERIAEQERLAREKAEQAARDAELASHELRRVAQHEVAPLSEFAVPHSEPTPEPVHMPEPLAMLEPVPTPEPVLMPEPVLSPEPQQAPEPVAMPEPQPAPAATPEPIDAPFTPVFEFEPVKPARVHEESAPAPTPPFANMFPPGSVQAQSFPPEPVQQEPLHPEPVLPEAVEPEAVTPEAVTPEAVQADPVSGIDEIRRLAAEAMSGIEKASHSSTPEPTWPSVPVAQAPQSLGGAAQTLDEFANLRNPATPASGAFEPVNPVAPEPIAAPQAEPQPQPEPNAWDLHPLEQAPTPQADPNDFTPVAAPVQPDFSALYQAAPQQATPFAPVTGTSPTVPPTGVLPTSGQFPTSPFGTVSPTASGQIPTESLATGTFRRPEIPAGPGPRDFKWLHLGVIGALMFVLGVFIYNVAFNQ